MTITTTTLTRAAGACAVGAGSLYIGVQVGHPHLDATSATTTEWVVRQSTKVLVAALSLIGITGMYLRQVRKAGILGLLGYVVFGAGYLLMLSIEFTGAYVLPAIAHDDPRYVDDVLAVAMGASATGDVGSMGTAITVMGLSYLGGGLLFGVALLRAGVLARWAAALLALGSVSTILIHVLPQVNERLFAVPTGLALIGLGHSLWREQRTPAAAPAPSPGAAPVDAAGTR